MVVIVREVLGGAFKHFSQAAGHEAVYRAGVDMGSLAASAVPPLLERLKRPLTLELLRRRLLDFQVFGWAVVTRVTLEDSLHGELELDQTFESIAWQGKAPEPTCDFLRGFTTGVFSTAYVRPFKATESRCQGKGDQVCSISFAPAT
jgi:predicted hydrocarbon binding protein